MKFLINVTTQVIVIPMDPLWDELIQLLWTFVLLFVKQKWLKYEDEDDDPYLPETKNNRLNLCIRLILDTNNEID